jgi:transcriptional pleiotropic regulator of transition state genes
MQDMRIGSNPHIIDIADEDQLIGTARRIDNLGRVVVPAELRRLMGIRTNELLGFRFQDGHIEIVRLAPECALCGTTRSLRPVGKKHLCTSCERDIRQQPECALCGRYDGLIERGGKHVCLECVSGINQA